MKQYKAALVGYGGMGHWHFEGICKTDRVKFVGVYDIDPKRMELAKSEGFEKLYDSYEAMLADASLDIIVVATPNNTHYEIVKDIIAHGFHIVCDKPVTFTSRESEELKALAGKLDEINATHLDRRIDLPGTQKELKTLAQAINAMLDRINEAYRSQMRFVSDASHELRTPLAAIHGYAELYKMQRDMPGALERADESIEHIERSSQRMTVLVEDLLSLARLDEGRGIDMTGTVKLSSLVTDAVDDLHALDPDRAVCRMRISLEPARDLNHPAEFNLAEGDWPEVVLPGDASRLRQVVTNIVGNIHRYTPADSPAEAALGVMPAAIDPRQLARMPASDASMRRFIEVGASMQTGYRYAVLRFVDHGPGVPPESRSKIFERFYTADPSRAREKGGTGLGMAIAQSVDKAHHGFICATGTDGGGLTFTVVLPIEQIAAPEPKQSTGKTKDAKQKTSWFSSERKTQATQPKA